MLQKVLPKQAVGDSCVVANFSFTPTKTMPSKRSLQTATFSASVCVVRGPSDCL